MYQYKVIELRADQNPGDHEELINNAAKENWELVSIYTTSGTDVQRHQIRAVFKTEAEDAPGEVIVTLLG